MGDPPPGSFDWPIPSDRRLNRQGPCRLRARPWAADPRAVRAYASAIFLLIIGCQKSRYRLATMLQHRSEAVIWSCRVGNRHPRPNGSGTFGHNGGLREVKGIGDFQMRTFLLTAGVAAALLAFPATSFSPVEIGPRSE